MNTSTQLSSSYTGMANIFTEHAIVLRGHSVGVKHGNTKHKKKTKTL